MNKEDSLDRIVVGLLGAGPIGSNLACNFADHGIGVALYDKNEETLRRVMSTVDGLKGRVSAYSSVKAVIDMLTTPRICFLCVPSGEAVDEAIDDLYQSGFGPHDIIVDCGNNDHKDSLRRIKEWEGRISYMLCPLSGGVKGARFGPSLMPSGLPKVVEQVMPILQRIAAKANPLTGDSCKEAQPDQPTMDGEPCVAWIGPDASGNFVKTTHNGIEYLIMQAIGEVVWLYVKGLEFDLDKVIDELEKVLKKPPLSSTFLLEATIQVLRKRDPRNPEQFLVWEIQDAAHEKGTGAIAVRDGLELRAVIPGIAEANFCRTLSSLTQERQKAAGLYQSFEGRFVSPYLLYRMLPLALQSAFIMAYAQGFAMMQIASRHYGWNLDLAKIARIWRNGCVIRSNMLQLIADAYERKPTLLNLMLDKDFQRMLDASAPALGQVLYMALDMYVPVPALTSTYNYFLSYTKTELIWAKVIQGLRDLFGAHGFYLKEDPYQIVHVDW
ncbi:MAG: hypothetical protein GX589_09870 [Deltaproteobacteria bacterium]|nr:hypothetical protein [Deltaproteobacteria bacterium]